METIRLKGLNKYAKERIKQHGRGEHMDAFVLKQRGMRDGIPAVLVESIDKSWKLAPGVPDTWAGWLKLTHEVEEVK